MSRHGSHGSRPGNFHVRQAVADEGLRLSRERVETLIEDRIQALVEVSPDAIVIVRSSGEITLVNSQAEKVFGYPRDELLGQPIEMLVPPRYRDRHVGQRVGFVATSGQRPMAGSRELLGLRKDGSEFPIEISLNCLETQEGIVVCSAIRDITERKKIERQIRQQHAKLAHFARLSAMGEMAARLAHEINQPLASIAAFADGMSLRLKRGEVEHDKLTSAVERIAADAHRAGEIIRRIRQFIKRREVAHVPVDANELAREVVRFMEFEAAGRGVSIELALADALPKVKADPVEIQQVILNLLRNAVDAADRGGAGKRICAVRSRRLNDGAVELSVEDNGPGISESLRQQVFEPFYTSKEEGLGLGLAISRSIVESHGGRIAAGPSSLGGAAIRITLFACEGDATDG